MSDATRTHLTAVTGASSDDRDATRNAANWALANRGPAEQLLLYLRDITDVDTDPVISTLCRLDRVEIAAWPPPDIPRQQRGPVLALWPDYAHLLEIAHHRLTAALCVVPSSLDEVAAWAISERAERLGSAADVLPDRDGRLADPITLAAMRSLSQAVRDTPNLPDGQERDLTLGVLVLLRESRHLSDPDQLYAWALLNRWPVTSALRLRTVAAVIATGAPLQPSRGSAGDDLLASWRKTAPQQ